MSSKFLRENLMLSFGMAMCLVGGIILYRLLNPIGQPGSNQRLDLIGKPAPEIRLTDLQGKPFVLSEWRGHTVMVNFWATWCPPCLKEVPLLIDFQRQGREHNLRVVGVAIDEPEALHKFTSVFAFNFPIVWTTARLMEPFGNGVGALPYSVLIDEQGLIVEQHFTPLSRADVDKILTERLGAEPTAAAPKASGAGPLTQEDTSDER